MVKLLLVDSHGYTCTPTKPKGVLLSCLYPVLCDIWQVPQYDSVEHKVSHYGQDLPLGVPS